SARLKNLDPLKLEHRENSQTEYSMIRTANAAIEAGKLTDAMKAIQSLVDIYQANEQNRIADGEQLKLLSALTVQARSFSDHGYVDE
ncbi:hypothetical protein ACSLVQ_29000, partial [Klebsiella pneumoniae]|uniref:hypothetical protein n=1 Tax=Klebsiella pneumoniae TaxID=573 RepID=UPI003EE119FE